jgi:hypothetical protein
VVFARVLGLLGYGYAGLFRIGDGSREICHAWIEGHVIYINSMPYGRIVVLLDTLQRVITKQ